MTGGWDNRIKIYYLTYPLGLILPFYKTQLDIAFHLHLLEFLEQSTSSA